MKTLYLYSDKTGVVKSKFRTNKIIQSLQKIYDDLTIHKTENIRDFEEKIRESIGIFDILIVAGGDGTLKFAVDVLLQYPKEKRPTLGYIPTGTVNDAGKAVGAGFSVRHSLRILKKGNVVEIDVPKVNNEHFNFVCAVGAFTDIAYVTKRGGKKFFGRIAYYATALVKIFKRTIIEAHIVADGRELDVKVPFILILNSKFVGGFPINFDYSIVDGKVELYLTKPGLFNGLLHYLFFKIKTTKIHASNIKVSIKSDDYWCFDGERGTKGDIEISVLNRELKVIGRLKNKDSK